MKFHLSWRVWILIAAVVLSIIAIGPSFRSGVEVKYVNVDSQLYQSGLRAGEIITALNGLPVSTVADYTKIVEGINFSSDVKFDLTTTTNSYTILTNQSPDLTLDNLHFTRIQTGLDLRGGARALVQPDVPITDGQLEDLISISRNRLNVYGLADVGIRGATDLEGNKYMVVEVAGATPGDLESLIAQQGKFDAKIGNGTEAKLVFAGGNQDIKDVCRTAQCSGVYACDANPSGGYYCNFRFTVYLNPVAAQRQADITKNLTLDSTGKYLSEKIYLYVDEKEVDSLNIGAELKGLASTEISIQGSGTGKTQQEALDAAKESMKKLQTVLITGSLPYKLNIVKLDTISPTLGDTFVYWIIIAGLGSIALVGLIVFAKYRRFKESLAVLATSLSEIIIILGVAAFVKWNLDLPSIAGILATIGTGVDQQIVILDEARSGIALSLKEKMKHALFIVFSAYFTALVSLIPLYWAGAGLFKGFAITTIIGITAGVLITRPAFSDIIKSIEEK